MAARPALVFGSLAARTKGGGWFFASLGKAYTRTHQQRKIKRREKTVRGGAGKERSR